MTQVSPSNELPEANDNSGAHGLLIAVEVLGTFAAIALLVAILANLP